MEGDKSKDMKKKNEQRIGLKALKKSGKGITLIALVITIVVLLILAGVTIATLTGDNGLLTRANEAKEKTEEAEVIEKLKIAILEDEVGNSNKEVVIDKKENYYILTYKDKKYLYTKNGEVTEYDNTLAYYIETRQLNTGDYIEYSIGNGKNTQNGIYTMTPEQTGYEKNQIFNVTSYDGKWQILYNGTEGYGVQIISTENILKNEEQDTLIIQRKNRL